MLFWLIESCNWFEWVFSFSNKKFWYNWIAKLQPTLTNKGKETQFHCYFSMPCSLYTNKNYTKFFELWGDIEIQPLKSHPLRTTTLNILNLKNLKWMWWKGCLLMQSRLEWNWPPFPFLGAHVNQVFSILITFYYQLFIEDGKCFFGIMSVSHPPRTLVIWLKFVEHIIMLAHIAYLCHID